MAGLVISGFQDSPTSSSSHLATDQTRSTGHNAWLGRLSQATIPGFCRSAQAPFLASVGQQTQAIVAGFVGSEDRTCD